MVATPQTLHEFVNFRLQYISGKERSQAQVFLDRFFQAFGHQGALQAGAEYEVAIKKGSKKGKTGFADLVWKPRVLIEMKQQGEDLGKHYRQAFNYWTRIVPNRPRYVMLCNFDQFWIYDFDNQVDEPVDIIELHKLPERSSAFGFMGLEQKNSIFQNNQVEVTKETARKMGELCEILKQRGRQEGFSTLAAQRLVLQCVLAMFAEDRGLLPQDMFIGCVRDCLDGKSSYDVLGGLFQEMNRPGITPAGKYKGVDYFNGGLFATVHPIELTKEELNYLDAAARENWKQVRPAIFGNIFEGTANQQERHAYGMHFTSEADIMKIVKPTISNYWDAKIDAANTIAELNSLQLELQNYRVLDPACGSGNFLYLAYQELKEIEKSLLEKIASRRRSEAGKQQVQMGLVTPLQFYGMDINPFAVELAKVTLTIAKKVAIDKLDLTEKELPLDTLDNNIVCQDALFTPWIKANAIIGNPPFLGGKHMRLNLGDEYVEKVFEQFPNVKDVDFCSYWFRLAHDNIDQTGRVGLVATNSISQGKSRKATLDYVTDNKGHIHEAISSQPWSGEAKVHVSIVNWSHEQPKQYFLDDKEVSFINSSLQPHIDVSGAKTLQANCNKCFQGVSPVGKDFIVTEKQVKEWIAKDSKNQEVLKLFSMGHNLAQSINGKPDRWIIDFGNMDLEDASNYQLPFEHIKFYIKPERDKNRSKLRRLNWWKHGVNALKMRKAIAPLSYYFTVPRVSKWAVFVPTPLNWLPGDKSVVVASEDYYVLGVLTSKVHRLWMEAQKSTLKADIAYTHKTCFETFPFPQSPTKKVVQQIRNKTLALHEYRSQQMEQKQWGITQLYNEYFHEPASKLYQLHQELDKLVMQAYGFKAQDDILAKLLKLNFELAEKETRGEKVIGTNSPFLD
ncbi:class I SAM-dependent DNA methyltransferase [Pleurocapsales cyanobacterium LEGE 10410]|nr:class I SAM-dependent DNA methyltransferase [Pleurocapsales cyanobacterium LEGE 10410]